MKTKGTLTLAKLNQLLEEADKYESEPDVIVVSEKVVAVLKKKYPNKYKEWLAKQKLITCGFQREFIGYIDNK